MEEGIMTTDVMEVYSLEEGDQILIDGELYRIVKISDIHMDFNDTLLHLVDEEGERRRVACKSDARMRVVFDEFV
jgi:translation elongation factor P/translation initiation factor 5A